MRAPPPSGLYEALRDDADKQAWVDWLFTRVAGRYDLGNDLMSLGWHTRWKRRLVEYTGVRAGQRVLDIASGTGDTAFMLADRGARVVGTDVNAAMLGEAVRKGQGVTFALADATRLPFRDASFDLVTCTYAGRGFPDWRAVAAEVFRVLRPGGVFWNLDFARPDSAVVDTAYRGWLMGSGAVLGLALHGHPKTYMYIPASMAHYPGQHWLHGVLEDAGFTVHTIETTLGLMAFHHGTRPE